MANQIPLKPKGQKDQIDMLWDACFNHLPTKLSNLSTMVRFIIGFLGLILALQAIIMIMIS